MYLAYYSRAYVNVTTMNIAPDQDNTYISFGPCLSGGNKFNSRKTGSKRYISTILIRCYSYVLSKSWISHVL